MNSNSNVSSLYLAINDTTKNIYQSIQVFTYQSSQVHSQSQLPPHFWRPQTLCTAVLGNYWGPWTCADSMAQWIQKTGNH